jgi:hypothetical protein
MGGRGAESVPLTEEDKVRQELVKELVQSPQKAHVEFAKHLMTVSFAAVGVLLSLKEKWLGDPPAADALLWLGIAIALFLASGTIATFAASAFLHRVSLADFGEIETELHRVARRRVHLTRAAFALLAIGTAIAAPVALGLG